MKLIQYKHVFILFLLDAKEHLGSPGLGKDHQGEEVKCGEMAALPKQLQLFLIFSEFSICSAAVRG